MKHAAFPALRAPLAPVRPAARRAPVRDAAHATAAVIGLGYVGLPTALALLQSDVGIVGVDVSAPRIAAIRRRDVDLLPSDHERLATALESDRFELTSQAAALEAADFVLICVPTPVAEQLRQIGRAHV